MMTSMNFAVGELFPLPVLAQADGGMFQVDRNGMMFLLQLSRTDAIAVEAFRTGEIELAVTEMDGVLFLLYCIDGIFEDGWGDALPLSRKGRTASRRRESCRSDHSSLPRRYELKDSSRTANGKRT